MLDGQREMAAKQNEGTISIAGVQRRCAGLGSLAWRLEAAYCYHRRAGKYRLAGPKSVCPPGSAISRKPVSSVDA
jgi:hypothetical protein